MTYRFLSDILCNRNNALLLERFDELRLPDAWLVAGCLFQTIWNLRSGTSAEAHIRDYDLFYFDPSDLGAEQEAAVQHRVEAIFEDIDIRIEVTNQARVHRWYPDHFGHPYPPLESSRDGIDRFLVLETCLGVRPDEVYAPNGVRSVYEGTLTPNPLTPYEDLYAKKVADYQERWSWLRPSDVDA